MNPTYPYGGRITSYVGTSHDFATYTSDSATGFDYAVNRWESTGFGRFLGPDRIGGGMHIDNPSALNRTAYSNADPVNRVDPNGLLTLILGGFGAGDPSWAQVGQPFNTAVSEYFGEQAQVWKWDGCGFNVVREIIGTCMSNAGEDLAAYIRAYKFAPGEKLNIVAHSEGGDVVKAFTNDYSGHSIDVLVNLGTPQRSDFSINTGEVKHYFNVFSDTDSIQPLGGDVEHVFLAVDLTDLFPDIVTTPTGESIFLFLALGGEPSLQVSTSTASEAWRGERTARR